MFLVAYLHQVCSQSSEAGFLPWAALQGWYLAVLGSAKRKEALLNLKLPSGKAFEELPGCCLVSSLLLYVFRLLSSLYHLCGEP